MAQLAIRNAFPDGCQGVRVDAACATAVSAPFLLDPAASLEQEGSLPPGPGGCRVGSRMSAADWLLGSWLVWLLGCVVALRCLFRRKL